MGKKVERLSFFEYLSFFRRYLGIKIFYGLILNIIIGLLDSIGLAMIFPLFQLVDDPYTSEGYVNQIREVFLFFQLSISTSNIFGFIILLFVLKALIKWWEGLYSIRIQQFFIASLRVETICKLSKVNYSFYSSTELGRIQNNLGPEVGKVASGYGSFFHTLKAGVFVVVYTVLALIINWNFAIVMLFGVIILGILFKTIFSKTEKLSGNISKKSNWYYNLLLQYTNSFKYLKATNLISQYTDKLKENIYQVEKMNYSIGKLRVFAEAIREPMIIIIVLATVMLYISMYNQSIGSILIGLVFFYRALNSMMTLQNGWNAFLSFSGAIRNIKIFTKELDNNEQLKQGESKIENINSLEIIDGSFYYDQNRVLNNINLEINKNETIAFVGESGSGKTTLVNVLSGLLPLMNGIYSINGVDINKINTGSFQNKIGYINQEPVIFDDTIYNNVTFWAEKNKENLAKFWSVLEKASILDFVKQQPNLEETRLGGNGMLVSGGQKQRISIAREFFKDFELLIMDEATSALDSETENIIQENIDKLKGTCTIVIVAHRLSTIKSADRIFLMSDGEIEGVGSFYELITTNDNFKKMVSLQEL